MKTVLYIFLFLFFSFQLIAQEKNYGAYVDPFIGAGGHGHTFPGATVPFGMVQLSPDTRIDCSWDGCSGYHYSDSIIYGFSHTHLSGTGCSDYGDILLMPVVEKPNPKINKYYSGFSHTEEKASAGYYSVKLSNNIQVELTSITRVGFHRYTFPVSSKPWIVLDLSHRDKTLETKMNFVNPTEVEGMRRSEAWAKDQHIYFVIQFSEPFDSLQKFETKEINIKSRYAFEFKSSKKTILVKVGVSTVSIEGARKNLQTELPGWDFEKTKTDAEALWNKELSKIEVTTPDKDKLKVFYTSLYHTMIQPNVAMDVDGSYRGRDNKIHKAEGFTYYSVFSLWDTFRAAHPLYTIIDQKRTSDFINTFLAQYEQGGRLPVWELASNETDCMIGYHAVSVIADAMVKGIKGFDYEKGFEASKHSAMLDHLGLKAYKQNGFISMDDESESVSKTLEYAYDDWCIAQMALILMKESDYQYFMKRSQSWKNVFDTETGFMRPKKNGGWLSPFDPSEVNNNFTEGNSWQYTFFVPQDIDGLIKMMGGNGKFENKLDELFTTSNKTTGREQDDITGLIGQYAHGNEPSHHMAYLYNYIGKPSKTQERIHQILTEFYKPTPDGLIGNEDCGQMSAWYVMSSIGFYQVTPGSDFYKIGEPLFDNVKIHLENGKEFSIETKNSSSKNIYIGSGNINKDDLHKLRYNQIVNGGKMSIEKSDKPNNEWDKPGVEIIKPPLYNYKNIIPVPTINTISKVFDDSLLVEIKSPSKSFFSILNTEQSARIFQPYSIPFYISASKIIFAYAEDGETKSDTICGSFYKRPNNWKIQINSKYNPQYTAGGDQGIIDGIQGDENWRKGEWQGYRGQDFEAVIDLGKEQPISTFSAEFLQDSRSWILMPTKVEFYISIDNKNFNLVASIDNTIKPDDNTSQVKKINSTLSKSVTSRFIKVKAFNFGKLPEWHQGAGEDAFIFIDEIRIE